MNTKASEVRPLTTGLRWLTAIGVTIGVIHAADPLPLPTPEQAAWQDLEVGMFYHFDIPVFTDHVDDWQKCGRLDPNLYNPEKLDTDQWMEAAKAINARYTVFVAKHCSGFLSWQSDLYPYGVKESKWRGGKGDVLRDYVESCQRSGLMPGVYVSWPANAYWEVDNPGLVNWGKGGDPQKQEAYARMYEKMFAEICGNYGPLGEIWFDGSILPLEKGGPTVIPLLKQLQPKAVVFQGPVSSIRWIGNENGVAGYPCWATVSSRDNSGAGDPAGKLWIPGECDVPVRNHDWFWRPNAESKLYSVDQLVEMYYKSVGRNCNLLLNANINRDGLVPKADMRRYREFGAEIRRRFGKSIAETSGNGPIVELAFSKPTRIDHVITMENIVEGERVREYAIEGLAGGEWKELARGTSIGHKKIDQFGSTEVSKLRWRCLKFEAEPRIRKLAAYLVQGVDVQFLKDYDPAGGAIPFYTEPQTNWKRLPCEDSLLNGVRMRIITPEKPLPGKPWILERGVGEPVQVARALLERGVYFVGMDADDFGSSQAIARWNALYDELTTKRGFSKKVVLEGYSRSGLGVYNWAAENPSRVACIYVDAPVLNMWSWPAGKGKGKYWPEGWQELQRLYGFKSEAEALAYDKNPVDKSHILAQANVPIIHVCGEKDEVVPYEENTGLFKQRYEKAGGRNMTIIIKGGMGHWTHGLKDPTPVVDFIMRAIEASGGTRTD